MNKLGLLFFLFICLGISSAQTAPQAASPRAKSSRQSALLAAQVADGTRDRLILNMQPDTPDSLDGANANACAYMRTYRVKRQTGGSDAVAPAGYTTCVPTRRFEMRSAVETRTESGRRKIG